MLCLPILLVIPRRKETRDDSRNTNGLNVVGTYSITYKFFRNIDREKTFDSLL